MREFPANVISRVDAEKQVQKQLITGLAFVTRRWQTEDTLYDSEETNQTTRPRLTPP